MRNGYLIEHVNCRQISNKLVKILEQHLGEVKNKKLIEIKKDPFGSFCFYMSFY